jgi:DNA repair protein RecN (Recombination protein N)
LKSLKIQNLILIEKAEIHFSQALNILTGETGSGKSAILSAIRLIAGERADASMIRTGAEFAIVEATLEGPTFIRREIHRSGKNRCFIDDAQVPLAQLKEAVNIELIDQGSVYKFFTDLTKMLDSYASIEDEVKRLNGSILEAKSLQEKLEKLGQIPKERELEWAQKDLEMIEEINWSPDLDENLQKEHHLLIHASEMADKIGKVTYLLREDQTLPHLKKGLSHLESCVRVDASLEEMAQMMKSALLELEEVGRFIESYADKLESNPTRLEQVEKQMGTLTSIKRRFGPDLGSIKKQLQEKINHLFSLDDEILSLKEQLLTLADKNQKLMTFITAQRKKAASPLRDAILSELQGLNLPHARLEISLGEAFGDLQFLFSANPGVELTPVQMCASGGELSRLLLAMKTVLSSDSKTLVFDEIDSNVGGQTATVLGQKLMHLAKKQQVICVTHFVQVAKCAMAHFLVSKSANHGSSYTEVKKLSEKEKEIEYDRMLGTAQDRK